jgi:hypothetical protein
MLKMTVRTHTWTRLAAAGAIIAALGAGALTAGGRSAAATLAHAGSAPAPSTTALNQRYTACIRSNGATWTPIANSGGVYRVDIPAGTNALCAGLDLAREAAGDGDAVTASWLARISNAPVGFWSCLGAAGFHITGGTGQRSDYGSADFGSTARTCAASTGVVLPSS